MAVLDFCLAGSCWDAASFLSLWTTSKTPITLALAAIACSTSTGKLAVNGSQPQHQRALHLKKSNIFKLTFTLKACMLFLRSSQVWHVQDVSCI